MNPAPCFFKGQLVYLRSDRLGRLFTVLSTSTRYGITWCEDPITGLVIDLDTGDLELAPRTHQEAERMLAEAWDEAYSRSLALGCWALVAGAVVLVGIALYFLNA